ncbi:hypothetical protein [Sphingosinicella sp. BN140058]|uniref:hypothetical protein n=1 Tax=Sphingosinicella sp. BN140058 TaxID=1892855 RepID=UPI001012F580|nr:hypothetical protein [Sphingosinicella sp. BN140058]QAY80135.1 hypothetical protein ETR14_26190 [Sphingosinicella sp. BN140058]
MLAWFIVPLEYLLLHARAERYIAKAAAAAGSPKHTRLMHKAVALTLKTEELQYRFPAVTQKITLRRLEKQMRDEQSK